MKRLVNICLYILVFTAFVLPPFLPAQAAGENSWIYDFPNGFKKSIKEDALGKEGYSYSIVNDNMGSTLINLGVVVEGVTVPKGTITPSSSNYDPQYAQFIYDRGVFAKTNNSIIALYSTPPASTAMAIRDMGESLGIIPKSVYAQGIGFAGLSPILPIWKAFRNIAYLLLAVVMVVIGFMVMLRKKIDPKTVVTVQNALPRIVVALILITFSYAIVGILIDLMYLLIYLALGIFNTTGLFNPDLTVFGNHPNKESLYINGNLAQVSGSVFPKKWDMIIMANSIIGGGGWTIATGVIGAVIGGIVGQLPGAILGGIAGAAGPTALVIMIISLAILFTLIRLIIMFLNAYIQIILALIISPIQLMLEAVPGANGFSGWIKNLISNLSVFPIAAVMFMLATVFSAAATDSSEKIWVPPYMITGFSTGSLGALFAFGILMAIPSVCASVKEALKAKSAAPGLGLGGIFAPIGGVWQSAQGVMSQSYYLDQMTSNGPEHPGIVSRLLGRGKSGGGGSHR